MSSASVHLMRSAEEERLAQPALIAEETNNGFQPNTNHDGGHKIGSASTHTYSSGVRAPVSTKSQVPSSQSQSQSHPHHPAKSASTPTPAASPSAPSSPLHMTQLPYYHPPTVFQSNAPYLASNASPSQLDGFTPSEEFQLRAHTCVFMSGIGQKLKLGQLALATASVFVQVFFTHYSFKAVDRLEIALTCLFLASKVEERRFRVDQVLSAYYVEKEEFDKKMAHAAGEGELYAPRPAPLLDSPEWDALRTRVYEYESIVLDAIEYNFDVLHPFSYLRKFLEKYIYSGLYAKESDSFIQRHLGAAGGVAQIAWNFINDSLRTSLCIEYPPSVICVVAIRMAMQHLIQKGQLAGEPVRSKSIVPQVMQPPGAPTKPWFEELFGLQKKTVSKIQSQIMAVLEVTPDSRKGNVESLLHVHRKSKEKSIVPLPCARSTQDLMAQLRQAEQLQQQKTFIPKQQQHQHPHTNQQQQPQHSSMPHHSRTTNSHSHHPHSSSSHTNHAQTSSSSASSHNDRKRPRSPAHDRHQHRTDSSSHSSNRRDDRNSGDLYRRPAFATAYSPLPCPPSPFLEATQPNPSKAWMPDLRPPHRREARERERDTRDRNDRDRSREDRSRDARRRSRSRSRRSRSRSRSRRRSTSRRRDHRVSTNMNVDKPKMHPSPTLEEGEVRPDQPQMEQLEIIREESLTRAESEQSTTAAVTPATAAPPALLVSPRLAVSNQLTKSCSTISLSSVHSAGHHAGVNAVGNSASSSSRLHGSLSMSNLSSAAGNDILSGDILRMSSCHSPIGAGLLLPVDSVSEEDIMSDISREANSLKQEKREEDHSPSSVDRMAKRARIGPSRTNSPSASSRSFESPTIAAVPAPVNGIDAQPAPLDLDAPLDGCDERKELSNLHPPPTMLISSILTPKVVIPPPSSSPSTTTIHHVTHDSDEMKVDDSVMLESSCKIQSMAVDGTMGEERKGTLELAH